MEFDFTTNQSVEDINAVPEQFRGAYVASDDGVYSISDTAKGLVEAVTGLNRSLAASRKEAKTLKGQVITPESVIGQIGEFDSVDAVKEHIAGLQTQLEEAAANGNKVNLDKMKADMEKAFAGREQEYKDRDAKKDAALTRYMVQAAATSALANAKGSTELLLPHVMGKARVVEDGDDYVVRVLDDAGDYRGDGKGGFMTIADLVKEMKASQTFSAAFESEAPPGTGAKPGQSQRAKPARSQDGDLSARDRIKKGLAARRAK
jgi:hypothetical protein